MKSRNEWLKVPAMLALLTVVVGVVAFAADRNYPTAPASFSVGTSSMMVAAPRMVTAPYWTTNAYSQGDMVRSTNNRNRVYWNTTTNAGTATTNPDHLSVLEDVTDGDITWRRIVPHSRMGIYVHNEGPDPVWLSIGSDASVSNGIKLMPGGTFWEDSKLQDSVHVISDGTTNTVITQEF